MDTASRLLRRRGRTTLKGLRKRVATVLRYVLATEVGVIQRQPLMDPNVILWTSDVGPFKGELATEHSHDRSERDNRWSLAKCSLSTKRSRCYWPTSEMVR